MVIDMNEAQLRTLDQVHEVGAAEHGVAVRGGLRHQSIAMFPEAPARLSTSNGCPITLDSRCAIGRASESLLLPGEKPTTTRFGLDGNAAAGAWAKAGRGRAHDTTTHVGNTHDPANLKFL